MIKIKVYISILYLLCISCKNSEIAQGTPESISKEIKKILHDEPKNPPIKVYSYIYENQKVYFFTSYCCDIPSRLYNSEGEIICHPDGGLTGKGDLKCLDFFQKATNMKLVWQDSRKYRPRKTIKNSMDVQYDIIVLGSGPGGYVAAIRSAQLGFKTAIVEKENLGGICLNWGCIPTKALLKSAEVLQQLLHAQEYGISAKDISADFESIIKRSRTVAEGMNKGIQFLMQKNKIDIVKGYGKVKPGRRIEVTSEDGIILDYKAKHIIIATGSSPRSLQNLPFDNKYVIDYRKAMTLEQLPSSLIVVGAGAIGVEFAYFYRSLGVEVTLVELSNRILPAEDEDISSALTKIFKRNGINILTTSRILANKIENDKCKVVLSTPNGEEVILADKILSATGVVANINNIGLEYTGIEVEKGKIKTDAFYRTNIEGFYAIGDIVQGPALAHVASAEGITCVESIAGHHPPMIQYDNIPGCIYCSPEIASVGITETKAREKGLDILVGKFPFSASGKAKSSGHSEGFVKIIFDKKYGEILGAHFIGDHVTEMIAEIVVAKNIEATGLQLLKSIHPHPTMSEAILEATAIAYGEGIHI